MTTLPSKSNLWAIVDVLTDRIMATDSDRWILESDCIMLAKTLGPRLIVVLL